MLTVLDQFECRGGNPYRTANIRIRYGNTRNKIWESVEAYCTHNYVGEINDLNNNIGHK